MSPATVELHPAAIAEARQARLRYASQSSVAAERFMAEVERAIERVGATPLQWSPHVHGTRRISLRRFPFHLVYQVLDSDVLVLAVAHNRRRPAYWKDRARPGI